MKKFLLLIITLFTISAKAQTSVYHPFPESNAVWNISYFGGLIICSGENTQVAEDYSYILQGDTVISSVSYHKLYIPFVIYHDTCRNLHYETAGYKGCIRQDVAGRKEFFIPADSLNEVLLYDFSLQPGDSLKSYQGNNAIAEVDSVLIGNSYRKKWILAGYVGAPDIIEGMGATTGPIEPFSPGFGDGPSWQLECFSQNGTRYYPDSSGIGCAVITAIHNYSQEKQFSNLVPNPFHTISTLNVSEGFEKAELKIYNTIGKPIKTSIIHNKSTIINREGLSDGIYFYRVSNAAGQVLTGKFVTE